ncbi:hypothetical protein PVK06_005474 [Gossypium arboreum]|uniref:Uncharacterized protein n=1 Tax=Gossypium arboreum TaxID=29729 RepID=A0ABR0QV49_GOSAR|nr:hypothetical protein PVK06_005474 [Gossypium arboreum]
MLREEEKRGRKREKAREHSGFLKEENESFAPHALGNMLVMSIVSDFLVALMEGLYLVAYSEWPLKWHKWNLRMSLFLFLNLRWSETTIAGRDHSMFASSSQAQASIKKMYSSNSTPIEISLDDEEEEEEAPSMSLIWDQDGWIQAFLDSILGRAKVISGKKRASKQPNTLLKKLKTKRPGKLESPVGLGARVRLASWGRQWAWELGFARGPGEPGLPMDMASYNHWFGSRVKLRS